ncbi:MAG: hypothetical protein JWO63_516 [Frankiales bacterium]|jgi:hypothetical protein|nr:hypothetical protein [Frankiales bacterium]
MSSPPERQPGDTHYDARPKAYERHVGDKPVVYTFLRALQFLVADAPLGPLLATQVR